MTTTPGPLQSLIANYRELVHLGLIQESVPPGVGILPLPGNPWVGTPLGSRFVYVHRFVVESMSFVPMADIIAQAQALGPELKNGIRKSGRRELLLMTVFLPVVLTHTWSTPTYPGSQRTLGQALVGFVAALSIPAGILALIRQNWLLAAVCVYWWLGAFLLAGEYRNRGLPL